MSGEVRPAGRPQSAGTESGGPESAGPEPVGGNSGQTESAPVRRALVVTVSNRAWAGVYADRGGPLIVDGLRELGFAVDGPVVVQDGDPVEEALRNGVGSGYDVIVTTGGTGLTPLDLTPDMTRRVIDREVPGIADAIRAAGGPAVPAAALSRAIAGVGGQTLIVNLPGSSGGVRDGLAVLRPILTHAVDQIHGGDH